MQFHHFDFAVSFVTSSFLIVIFSTRHRFRHFLVFYSAAYFAPFSILFQFRRSLLVCFSRFFAFFFDSTSTAPVSTILFLCCFYFSPTVSTILLASVLFLLVLFRQFSAEPASPQFSKSSLLQPLSKFMEISISISVLRLQSNLIMHWSFLLYLFCRFGHLAVCCQSSLIFPIMPFQLLFRCASYLLLTFCCMHHSPSWDFPGLFISKIQKLERGRC